MRNTFRNAAVLLASASLAVGGAVAGASVASAAPVTETFIVDATVEGFVNSGIELPENTTITVTAVGIAGIDPANEFHADANGLFDICVENCAFFGPSGSLGISIGGNEGQFVGTGPSVFTGTGDVLFAYNDNANMYGNNVGSFIVTVTYDDGIVEPEPEPGCTGSVCLPTGSFGF